MEGMYAKLTALCMCIHETFCIESIAPFAKITLFALQIGRLSSYTLTYITKHFMLVLRIFNIAIVHKEISDFLESCIVSYINTYLDNGLKTYSFSLPL